MGAAVSAVFAVSSSISSARSTSCMCVSFSAAIADTHCAPLAEAERFFGQLPLSPQQAAIAEKLLIELQERLRFLNEVGLEYLTLDRLASTLSGGEAQRIQLATSLGSRLVGTLYVLDEPSIGLHSRDTHRLIKILHD